MPRKSLTNSFINELRESPPAHTVSYFDTELPNFMVEHRKSGGATYYFRYRDWAGKIRMVRIGRLDELTLIDARAKAFRLREVLREDGDPKLENRRLKDMPTFGAFVTERYLPYASTRKRSWKTDETILRNHLLPRFGDVALHRVRRADVIEMQLDAARRGYAAGTVNRLLVLTKFIFNCAIRWEVIPPDANPCTRIEPLDDNGARERFLSREEVSRLFAELDRNRNVQVGQVIRLLLYTGARKREILDARWEHIDIERRILTVPVSKSGKPRHVSLSDAAVQLLQALPREPDIPWVFFNPRTRKPPRSIFYAWDSIRSKVGLQEVRLHDLRHSFASFLVNSGRSLYEVQRLLGHYDPKITMRYAHLSQRSLVEAANVVGDLVTHNDS